MNDLETEILLSVKVRLHWSESDIASSWVHTESSLMDTLISYKDQVKNSLSRPLSLSVNEPLFCGFILGGTTSFLKPEKSFQ